MSSPEVALRSCSSEDAATLALVAAATMLEAFAGFIPGHALLAHCHANQTAAKFAGYLSDPATRAWLAEVEPGQAPVGYALLTAPDLPTELVEPGDLELKRIYLFSRFHGDGTGPRLLQIAIAEARAGGAKRLLLGVHPENHRALTFYQRNGFRRIGTRAFHVGSLTFEDPVLALVL